MADEEVIARGLIELGIADNGLVDQVLSAVTAVNDGLKLIGAQGPATLPLEGVVNDARSAGAAIDQLVTRLGLARAAFQEYGAGLSGNAAGAGFIDKQIADVERLIQTIERARTASAVGAGAPATSVAALEAQARAAQAEGGVSPRAAAAAQQREQAVRDALNGPDATEAAKTLARFGMGELVAKVQAEMREAAPPERIRPDIEAARANILAERDVTRDPVYTARAGVAAAEDRLSVVSQSSYPNTELGREKAQADVTAALKALSAAEDQLVNVVGREARAEEKAAAAREALASATERAAAQANDPRVAALSGTSQEFLGASGADSGNNARGQVLQAERQRLLLAQQQIREQAVELETETDIVAKVKATDALLAQRERVERQLVANANSQIANAQRQDRDANRGGGGGFVRGIFGSFGGDGGEGGGFGDLAYQAGTAIKYAAIYQVFAAGEHIIRGVAKATEEYTFAVNNLAIALQVSHDEADQTAQSYAAIGATLGTGPVQSIEGATKFARSFRDANGNASATAGAQGAEIAGLVNTLEGGLKDPVEQSQAVQKTMQDIIAITKAYELGPEAAKGIYDQATVVAQQYGYQRAGEVLPGVAAIGDIGRESGYSVPQLVALIASVMQATGVQSDAAAGDIKRFLGAQNTSTVQGAFDKLGVNDPDKTFSEKLTALSAALDKLPKEQAQAILTSIGGSRTGAAVASAIIGIPSAQRAEEAAANAAGTTSEQAALKLNTFAGAMQNLESGVQQFYTSLSNSGVGDLLGVLVRGITDILRTLTALNNGIHEMGPVVEDTLGVVVTALVAYKAVQATRGAVSTVTTAVDSVKSALAAEAQNQQAAAAAKVAVTAEAAAVAETEQAAATTEATVATEASLASGNRLTQYLKGLGPAFLGVAAAAVAAAAILIGEAKKASDAQVVAAGDVGNEVNRLAGLDPTKQNNPFAAVAATDNADDLTASIDRLATSKQAIIDASNTFGGKLVDVTQQAFLTGKTLGQTRDETTASIQRLIDAEKARRQALVDPQNLTLPKTAAERKDPQQSREVDAARAAATADAAAADSNPFGRTFENIGPGISKLIKSRIGPEGFTAQLDKLIYNVSVQNLGEFLQPTKGQQGAPDAYKSILQQIAKTQDPTAQLEQYRQVRESALGLLSKAQSSGTSDQIDSAQAIVDQANTAYLGVVVKNTNARIASIKAFEGNNAKSQAEIRALLTDALNTTTQAGDVQATISLLNTVDTNFITTYRKQIQSLIDIQNQLAATLQEARNRLEDAAAALAESSVDPNAQGADAEIAKRTANAGRAQTAAIQAAQAKANDLQKTALGTLDSAQGYSAPSGSAFNFSGNGPTAQQIEEARIASQQVPGDSVSAAATALRIAQYKLDNPDKPGDQQEYYQNLKALHQAQFDLAKAQNDQSAAVAQAGVTPGDQLGSARANVRAAQLALAATASGSTDYYNALRSLRQAQYDLSRTESQIAVAQIEANTTPGDPLAQAETSVTSARIQLSTAVGGTTDYYSALKSLRQAQYDLGRAELDAANQVDTAGIDITDPVAQAQEKVREAQRALSFDSSRGAGSDVLNADRNTLRQAQSSAEKSAFDQQFSDYSTNYNLNRISLTQYLQYLNSQHDYLSAVGNKTRQQVDELNQVDQALKGLSDQLQGQFNLGDIKVPSPYEARRAIAAGSYSASQYTQNVDININGADLTAVRNVLSDYLGQGATQTTGTLVRKVPS